MDDMIGDDFLLNRTGSSSLQVAVKMLQQNASEQARYRIQHMY